MVLVEEKLALLTVVPHGVVLALVAYTSGHIAGRHEHRHIKVARVGVVVALTLCRIKQSVDAQSY